MSNKRKREDEVDFATKEEEPGFDRWLEIPSEIWSLIFQMMDKEDLLLPRFACKLWFDLLSAIDRLRITNYVNFFSYKGYLNMLKWFRRNIGGCEWRKLSCDSAAKGGHLEVLRWLDRRECRKDANTCTLAAKGGHLEILKWLKVGLYDNCPHDKMMCLKAAKEGHLHVIKWTQERGYLSELEAQFNHFITQIGYKAAYGGQLHVLKWARENGCELDTFTSNFAAKSGDIDTLKWLMNHGCPISPSDMCGSAAYGGHLPMIKWLLENGYGKQWYWHDACKYAADGGHLHTLKWLRENGYDWDHSTCEFAVRGGHFDVLKWALKNGCKCSNKTFEYAAEGGHLHILVWLRENVHDFRFSTPFYSTYQDSKSPYAWAHKMVNHYQNARARKSTS